MARVYVSSTISDLRAERQAVMDWLVAAQHQVVHSYRPDSDTVRDSCLADVDTCDLYVLIVGHRYGFQPPEDNPEGLSITRLEFRRAGQSGKPRIVLLRTSIPDISLSDVGDPRRLALVQTFRDEVAAAVRAAEFGDLRGLVAGLSTGVQAGLEKIQAEAAGQPAARPSRRRVVRLAPRPPFLAGREDLLAELDARLADGDGSEPRVVALHGLAGAGKTSVALAYAHTHRAEAGITWQLAAEDPAVLVAAFTELATALGAREGAGDPVAAVHGALAGAAGWLLVFDNAPGPEAVQAFVPPMGGGRVLITSRNALWPPGQGLEVPVLDLEAAAGFLATRTGDTDRQAAVGLAGAVGGLPLALEQAAAYAQATGNSLADYLALFHQRRTDLLARGQVPGYGTVATTWALAFGQLQESAPGAAGLLRLLAFCAPEEVPLRLLLRPRTGLVGQLSPEVAPVLAPLLGDELAAGDAVAALRRYSLARPAGDGAVSVHRLVQAVTVGQMPGQLREAWQQATAALIEAALPDNPRRPDTWSAFAALLPHAQAALPPDSRSMANVAAYLGYSGGYAAARDFSQAMLEERARGLGLEHLDTLTARAHLAYWTGMAGDVAGARDQFAVLLPIHERALGPEHRETLAVRSNVARWTGRAGDAAVARDQFAALLPIRERVLGPEHPDTLTTRGELAYYIGDAGDAAGARDQFAALLPIQERVQGPEHPDTLTTRGDLASWIGDAGDAAGARDQFAALLPIRERVLGPEHPNTLIDRSNLAYYTGEAGDAAGACDQFAALLPIQERVLGPEHPDTLITRGNLAYYTGEAGDAAGAGDQFAALLPIRERVLGPEHPDTLTTRQNLTHWTREAADDVDTGGC
ncbi:MAG TPA: tetratricopeptide repeat protein [Streptosporangiaceae bacterium]|nr:tetratricopeptide repeat protein [Streptosporangiaceae bacterium]